MSKSEEKEEKKEEKNTAVEFSRVNRGLFFFSFFFFFVTLFFLKNCFVCVCVVFFFVCFGFIQIWSNTQKGLNRSCASKGI